MIEVLASFAFMLSVCTLTGFAVAGGMRFITKSRLQGFSIVITGIVSITVLSGYLSIFTKIGALANFMVLAIDGLYIWIERRKLRAVSHKILEYALKHRWELLFYIGEAIIIAYFTSRGNYHTDTNLYHAANIRIYEETRVIKGLANVFNNYGYNSMYHAFCAFFSEHWLLSKPWHTTSGFLAFIFSVYSTHRLKSLNERRVRLSDGGCIAMLIYVLNILYYTNSPATDYAAMLFALYMMTEWIRVKETTDDVLSYANLCILGVYILTLKISAGMLIVAVIYPACVFLREKRIKDIFKYLLIGLVVSLPYFIRNFFISGWLVYPFKAIDIFNVRWKVPLDILEMDVAIIGGSGKCLFDMPADLPISQWVPIWWEAQEYYGKLLVLSAIFAICVLSLHEIYRITKKRIDLATISILFGNLVSLILWFVEAPFIRYGLAFLLFPPCLTVAVYLSEKRYGFRRIVMGLSAILILFLMLPFVDHYFGDNIGFVSMHKSEPYYVFQKDYDRTENIEIRVGNVLINGAYGATNSYYAYPSTTGPAVDSRLRAFGDTFEEGFYMQD